MKVSRIYEVLTGCVLRIIEPLQSFRRTVACPNHINRTCLLHHSMPSVRFHSFVGFYRFLAGNVMSLMLQSSEGF